MLANAGAVIGCSPTVRRGALRLGLAGRGPSVTRAKAAGLLLALPLRKTAGALRQGAAQLVFAAVARGVEMGPGRFARGLTIVKALRRVAVTAARKADGPGESVGEVVHALPGALATYPLPVGFIGRKLAALAVARGEVAEVAGNALLVGGRVVIEPGGEGVFVATAGAAKAVRALQLEAGHVGEGVMLAAGPVRDAWLSDQRTTAANYVKKYAKLGAKIEDAGRRAAALADLRFMELRA